MSTTPTPICAEVQALADRCAEAGDPEIALDFERRFGVTPDAFTALDEHAQQKHVASLAQAKESHGQVQAAPYFVEQALRDAARDGDENARADLAFLDGSAKESRKYASGNWTHLFGVGSRETTCRIVIDLEKPELIAAQEWTGLKYEDVLGDRLKDLAESVLDANDAHENPEEYGLEVGAEVPDWASKYLVQEAHANALETLSSLKLDAMQLVKVQNAIDLALPSENGRDYECGFKDALQSMCLALAEKLDANELQAVINTALDAYGNNVDLDVDDSPSLGM